MRFLHISDLHIGKIVNGFNMLEDQRFALEGIIEIMKRECVQGLLVAGDIYDKSTPSAEAVRLFDWFICTVSKLEIPIYAIPGNHDSSERIAFAQTILQEQGVFFPPVYNGEVTHHVLQDEFGPVNIWLLPFVKPIHVREFYPEEEIGQDYTAALNAVLSNCKINPNERNVILSHQFVTASEHDTQREDSELSLGGIDNVDASVFHAFDYVALGHVHRPQRIERDTIRYSGSLLKYSFSEARYPKSAVLVTLNEKRENDPIGSCVSWKQIDYPTLRDMRVIKGPLSDLLHSGEDSHNRSDDYVQAILTDKVPQIDAMARMREIYPNIMQLEYERQRRSSTPDADEEEIDIDRIDPIALFGRFFEEQVGKPPSDSQAQLYSNLMGKIIETSANECRVNR